MSLKLSPVFLLLSFVNLTYASNTTDEILISADRIETNQNATTSKIELINNKQIESLKNLNLESALENYSDLNIVKNGQSGNTSSVFIRGMEASHTLVVLDGIVLNDPTNPNRQFDFSKINLSNIEKIEILKGSQGLLYGSNAIGGVIVLTSKKKKKNSFDTKISYGTYNTLDLNLNTNNVVNNQLVNFGISFFNTTGFSSANDNSHSNDKDGNKKIALNAGSVGDFIGNTQYDFRVVFNHEKIDLDKGGGKNADDPNYTSKNQSIFTKLSIDKIFNEKLKSKFQYSYTQYSRRSFDQTDPYQTYDGSSYQKGSTNTFEVDNTYFYNDFLTQDYNLGHSIESDSKHNNSNTHLFFYNRFEYGPALLNAGLRFDYNEIFKEALTYKLAIGHKFSLFDLHTSFSTGFRAPSLNQLFDSTYGNKNLKPEKSRSIDLGFLFDRTSYSIDTTFFYTHIEDRLTYHPTTYVNINAGRSYSKGIEEAITLKINESLKQLTRLNLTESFNLSNGTRLARRPEFMAFHGYEYSNDLWSSTLNGKFKSSTSDVDNNGNSTKNKEYVTFNFDVEYSLSKSSKLGLNVENILDENFQDVWGYNNGGRMINLRYKMSF